MRISDWSSDVCSSDLNQPLHQRCRPRGIARIVDQVQARHIVFTRDLHAALDFRNIFYGCFVAKLDVGSRLGVRTGYAYRSAKAERVFFLGPGTAGTENERAGNDGTSDQAQHFSSGLVRFHLVFLWLATGYAVMFILQKTGTAT